VTLRAKAKARIAELEALVSHRIDLGRASETDVAVGIAGPCCCFSQRNFDIVQTDAETKGELLQVLVHREAEIAEDGCHDLERGS
jgi:hypothetical protein